MPAIASIPSNLWLCDNINYVRCESGPTNFTDEITVEAWIWLYGQSGVVVGHQNAAGDDGYIMSVLAKQLIIELANGTEKVRLESSRVTLDDGWHHIAFTLKNTIVTAYIDGDSSGTAVFKSPIKLHTPTLYFARDARNTRPFRGELAEVRIWNKARTQDEITASMFYRLETTDVGQPAGLVGYWPLAGNPRDLAGENHHGLKQGGRWSENADLQLFRRDMPLAISSAYDSQNYAQAVVPATQLGALTIEAWVQAPGDCNGNIVQWVDQNGAPLVGLAVAQRDLAITFAPAAQQTPLIKIPNALIASTWQHIALTWNKTTNKVTVFIDGIPQSPTGSFSGTLNLPAGCIRFTPYNLRVADVRIWNIARPPDELLQTRTIRLVGNEPNLFAYWRLDQPGRSLRDQTGKLPESKFERKGVYWAAVPDLPLQEARVANPVLAFDGRENFLDAWLNLEGLTEALTVEAWVYVLGDGFVLFQGNRRSAQYEMSISSNKLIVAVRNDGFSAVLSAPLPAATTGGSWHHLAFALRSDSVTTYVDGVAHENKLPFKFAFDKLRTNLTIGRQMRVGYSFKGELAEVRIWSVARSAQQINAACFTRLSGGEAGLVAYFPLSEGTGHSISERVRGDAVPLNGQTWISSNGLAIAPATARHAATSPTAPALPTSVNNTWLELDGLNDYLDCGSIDFASGPYTIETWVMMRAEGPILAATVNNQHGLVLSASRFVHRYPPASVGGANILLDNAVSADSQWHHIAVVRSETLISVFVDGTCVKELPAHTRGFSEAPRVQIGRLWPNVSQNSFHGGIRDLRIWSIARTAQEITQEMHHRLLGTEVGLFAYWPLDEGVSTWSASGYILPDRTGKHTLTLYGAKWVSDNATTTALPELQAPDAVVSNDAPNPTESVTLAPQHQSFTASDLAQLSGVGLDPSLQSLANELQQANNGNTLTLEEKSFSGFNLFKTLDGLLVDKLGIRDYKVTVLGVAERTKSDTVANSATAQASTQKFGGEAGLNITGKVDLLGLSGANITVEFVVRHDKSTATFVKIEGGDLAKDAHALLGSVLPAEAASVLNALGVFTLSNLTLAFATEDFDDIVPPYNLGVRPGLNLFGTLKTDQFGNASAGTFGKVLKFVAGLLGLDALTVRIVLHKSSTGLELGMDSVIEHDVALVNGRRFSLIYRGLGLNLSVRGTPPEPSLAISNQLILTLTYLGAEDLLLAGIFKAETESFTGSYTLQSAEDKPWHPFGFSQLSVAALSLQIGGTYTQPFIDNLGIAAKEITIGEGEDAVKASLAVLIDFNDPDQFVLVIETPGITLLQLISCFSLPTLVAYQALPSAITNALNTIINVKLKGASVGENAKISIVPAPTRISKIDYDEEGIHANGTLSLWGWEATTTISFSPEMVDIRGELTPVNIQIKGIDIFSLRGAADNDRPTFSLYLGSEDMPEFFMSLSVTLMMIRTAVYARLDDEGLKFTLDRSLGPIHTSLSVIVNSTGVEATGKTTFSLNLSLPVVGVGSIQLVDVAFIATTTLKAGAAFYLKLEGTLNLYGISKDISLTFDEPISNFSQLFEKVVAYFLANAADLFKTMYATLEVLGQAVVDGVVYLSESVASVAKNVYALGEDQINHIIDVSRTVGDGAVTIAAGMKSAYGWTEAQTAHAFKAANYVAREVVDALWVSYQAPAARIKVALDTAGYAAVQIFEALSASLIAKAFTPDQFTQALKAAGFAADQIATGLMSGYELANTQIIRLLKGAQFTVEEIAKALKIVYKLTESAAQIVNILAAAGYGVEDVAKGVVAAWEGIEAGAVAGVLKGAQIALTFGKRAIYTVADVAKGVQAAYGLTAAQVVPALFKAQYAVKDVAIGLKDGCKLGVVEATKALEQASALVDLATGNAKTASQIVVGQAVVIGSTISASVVPITSVVKDVYNCMGESAAAVLKAANVFTSRDVAKGLQVLYLFSAMQTASALKEVGYLATDTIYGLQAVYRSTPAQVAQALKAANYALGDVVKALKDVCFFTDGNMVGESTALTLKVAGYPIAQVVQGLNEVLHLSNDAAAIALHRAGYAVNEVAQALQSTYHLSGDAAAAVLKGAGYSANQVGDALHTTYNYSLDQTKKALGAVGFAASSFFNMSF